MGLFGFGAPKEDPEATRPANDGERWIAAACAIWSEYCGGSCRYLGGYQKTKANAKLISRVLRSDWDVKDHDSGVEMVEYLLKHAGPSEDGAPDTTAFDYASACNMCGRMFIAGYFTREEALRYAGQAARRLQERYHSWEEYYEAYIRGAAAGSNVKDEAPFREAYQKVKASPDSPMALEWNTILP